MMKKISDFLKRASVCILSAFLIFSEDISIMARADEIFDDGAIHISTIEDWNKFASSCRLDSWSQDITVVLDANLNIKDCKTVPTFGGTFDGNGHVLNGLMLRSEGNVQGLFRYVREGAVIKNLTVTGVAAPVGNTEKLGIIAGENRGNIKDCKSMGIAVGKSDVGGIAGINETSGRIENCEMVSGSVSSEHFGGGIAGENYGSIVNCSNHAKINTRAVEPDPKLKDFDWERINDTENMPAATDTGGIAGYSHGFIQNCANYGSIGYPHLGYNIGGIVGRQSGLMTDCVNYGDVQGRKDVGGIAGQAEPFTELQYQETTLQKLGRELDNLSIILDDIFENTDSTRQELSAHISNITDNLGDAQKNVSDLIDGFSDMGEESIDTINDLSVRIRDFLKDIVNTLESMKNAASRFAESLAELEAAAEEAAKGSDSAKDAMAEFNAALEDIHNMLNDIIARIPSPLDMDTYRLPISDMLEIIQEKIDEITDVAEYIKDDFAIAVQGLEEAVEHIKEASGSSSEVADALDKALKKMKNAAKSLSGAGDHIGDAFKSFKSAIEGQSDLPALHLPSLPDNYREDKKDLHKNLKALINELESLNKTANAGGESISEDMKRVNKQFDAITDVLRSSGQDDGNHEIVVDVSNEDALNASWGKIQNCKNTGRVEGDVNIGGISGAMAIEYDFDPEDDVVKKGDKSFNFKYYTRAIIYNCENSADITSKKDCAGSIVGRMDLGVVLGCRGFGAVESTSGEKVGGIAGLSSSLIKDSWSKCRLKGTKLVGGIAGTGHDIKSCRSLVDIDEESSFKGAIAGDLDGIAKNNFFVDQFVGGIDDISYKGKAEPLPYDEFIKLDGVPKEFKKLIVKFKADDNVINTVSVGYGEKIKREDMPEVPAKDGFYGSWPEFGSDGITFNEDVEAVYTPWLTAVSNEDGKILAEGRFQPDTILKSEKIDGSAPVDEEHNLGVYRIYLPEGENEFTALRIAVPENAAAAKLWILNDDGSWKQLEAQKKDSYLRCDVAGKEVTLCVASVDSYLVIVLLAAGAAVIAAIVLVIHKKAKKRKKDTENKKEDKREVNAVG